MSNDPHPPLSPEARRRLAAVLLGLMQAQAAPGTAPALAPPAPPAAPLARALMTPGTP